MYGTFFGTPLLTEANRSNVIIIIIIHHHSSIVSVFRVPDSLEDLKFVLKTINDIKDMSLEVEFQYLDIKERYRTLDMYNIPVR